MRSVSPSYRYKGFNKKQFDLASNRSKEREKVFTSRTRVYPMKTDKKLSDVNTKLEKLRH